MCVCVYVCVYVCECVYVSVCVCMCVYLFVMSVHTLVPALGLIQPRPFTCPPVALDGQR